ncbi:unnamed protein product [Heligmosomoides polygyrus]|uniref:Serpentine receptor class gamma n=1 Tax=Heligmosomoides polygyrus TaxID=6339 RepID=A0A183GLU2_HELPZ|nr:unnamed protein product [Heligmosomoides polygyrus]
MPVLFSFPTKVLYFLVQFGFLKSTLAEYTMFAISPFVTVVDPCITVYYVLPYRKFIKGIFTFGRKVPTGRVVRLSQSDTLSNTQSSSF